MGLFRKKSREADIAVGVEDIEETSDVPREVSTKGNKRTSSRSLGKWLGGNGSSSSKKEDKKKSVRGKAYKSNTTGKHRSTKISHANSASTASSGKDDARDDRPQIFHATTSKEEPAELKFNRQKDADDLANSLCSLPPPAAQAAFDGPPRFDWIDIEYNAATMIQSVFRRYMILQAMEAHGMTTSYIRNRKRQRKARKAFFKAKTVDETAPDFGFGCCVMGMDFCGTDFDTSDAVAYQNYQRQQYKEKKKAQKEREEYLSNSYLEQKGLDTSLLKVERAQTREDLRRF